MEKLGLNEIREKYLSFFESKEHLRLKSFSLVPNNDKSLLVINSGMAPLKPYFTGQQIPPSKRITTCQKCIRTNDVDNVGKTSRHGTFFEMLGNFSFGDYFKEEIIPWSWEFLTEVMKVPEDRLFVSVYLEDDEAYDIWNKKVGLQEEKIFRMGKDDNFWEVGVGPCGPCSEIYFDRGEKYGCKEPGCTVGCDCDRFMEVWNLVFTQFNKEEDGSYSKLKNVNVDTGMGLERISVMMQDVGSIFDVDTLKTIRDEVCKLAGKSYNKSEKDDYSIRVITDHLRSMTFMTADGILPSNEGVGYILRRLLRRAARHGKLLGIKDKFLAELVKTVIKISKSAYPELEEKQDYIFKLVSTEETRFYETLDAGMEILKNSVAKIIETKQNVLDGNSAFRLYDTYGFPLELMEEILSENNLTVNVEDFRKKMEEQRERGRAAREESTYMGASETVFNKLDKGIVSEFVGYNSLEYDNARVCALISDNSIAEEVSEGSGVTVILDKSVLYPEGGGQAGDSGIIETQTGRVEVEDCMKALGNKIAASGKVVFGTVKTGQSAKVMTDKDRRMQTARNHSATHLLQKALRIVLGKHVEQSGSFVSHDRLRFDFTHFSPVTSEELLKIEDEVNARILEALNVDVSETGIDEARAKGAMALFGEKYGDVVRMVDMGGYSVELCGGTHIRNTAQIGSFKILSETGVAAGVRRIEAVTGTGALSYYRQVENKLDSLAYILKATVENVIKRAEAVVAQSKDMSSEIEKLRQKLSAGDVENMINRKININGVDAIIEKVAVADMSALRLLGDSFRDKLGSGIVVLLGEQDGKANLLVTVTSDVAEKGVNSGTIAKEASKVGGGSGGGKPTSAQAGIKDVSKAEDVLKKATELVKDMLGTAK